MEGVCVTELQNEDFCWLSLWKDFLIFSLDAKNRAVLLSISHFGSASEKHQKSADKYCRHRA